MKKNGLVMCLLLVAVASQAAGCIFVSDDEDEGQFQITWDVVQGGQQVNCADVGADTVSFLFTDSLGDGSDELFDCQDFAGTSTPLPYDDYTLSGSILNCVGDTTPNCSAKPPLGTSPPVTLVLDQPREPTPKFVFSF
jgi:hypothetical protein